MPYELHGMRVLVAVAAARSFRVAGERLGVTRSAVSQAVRRLEDDLGVTLVERTTRSVRLTEAGAQLYATASTALEDLDRAVERTREVTPSGLLRITTSSIAENFLAAPTLAGFLAAYPQIQLDITVSDDDRDIVADGYDAGVRLGEVIARDMIALSVSAKQRQIAVASPAYLRAHRAPTHPR